MNINLEALNAGIQVSIPDLQILNIHYGKLGNQLHSIKEPDDTVNSEEWWESFFINVQESEKYLYSVLSENFGSFKLNERGLEIFERWEKGQLSNKEVISELRSDMEQNR